MREEAAGRTALPPATRVWASRSHGFHTSLWLCEAGPVRSERLVRGYRWPPQVHLTQVGQ